MYNKTVNNKAAPKWYQKHKKALIIGGTVVVVVTAAVITYVVLRKKPVLRTKMVSATVSSLPAEPIIPLSESADQIIKRARPTSPIYIDPHIRRLPKGQHASMKQLKIAESLGIEVSDGCTCISGFTKYNNLTDCA